MSRPAGTMTPMVQAPIVPAGPPPATAPTRVPLLSVRGLQVHYGDRRALADVDLEVGAGEIVALAGENGAGKSTLVRCIGGNLTASGGEILLDGDRLRPSARAAARRGVAVVWQDLALCDNLDVAANLMLGRERWLALLSDARFHARARDLLVGLGVPITDTTRTAGSLSGGQRQLLAVARAMRDRPRLLILDEPTASLGVLAADQIEDLIHRLRDEGTTVLLVSHDVDQMFRLADRIVVLRHGRAMADLPTATGHPDEVVAHMSGQPVDSSPRRQLDRLHSLVGRLSSVAPSSSLAVILSALGTALAADRLCIHLLEAGRLRLSGAVGLPAEMLAAWTEIPLGTAGGPVGAAASRRTTVVDDDVRSAQTWQPYRALAERAGIRSSWAVPVRGAGGLLGVITVFRSNRGAPHRDELDLVTLYAGYAASAAERDTLLGEVTGRNRVLETIRVVLEALAGSVGLTSGLDVAVETLRDGLGADQVGLFGWVPGEGLRCRGWSSADGRPADENSAVLQAFPSRVGGGDPAAPVTAADIDGYRVLCAPVDGPGVPLTLLAAWSADPECAAGEPDVDAYALVEDAARSFQLALERERSERAHREAAGLRRSQELQRDFLSRLSHELRTPLTAIQGYAETLLQTDVSWDEQSESRFLRRIATESARLGRLVGDLLDLSAIDSNVLRLQRDWCDVALVVEAARACVPLESLDRVTLACPPLPAIWADHDRLEQVLVNLIDNALRHNPPDTEVLVTTRQAGPDTVAITIWDNGIGLPPANGDGVPGRQRPVSATAGAGLGLSIARAIVLAHDGTLHAEPAERGTCWQLDLPVLAAGAAPDGPEEND